MAKKKATAKKATTKKATTKKATPKKKTAAKKAAPKKKTATKKTTATTKKAAPKKTVKKKTVKKAVKKTAAAKKVVKKKAVKKKAVKKAAVKKAAVKKAAVKKAATPTAAPAAPATTATSSSTSRPKTSNAAVEMGKLAKGYYPEASAAGDFQCFGPPATQDGDFETCRIADMGCFTQDGKDSNKYYHGAVVQQQDSKNWYAYFEWGRTGAAKPSFQFIGCRDEAHAQQEFAKQLHAKNDRRGQWVDVAGIRTLQAKPNKDCYLVRPMATRSTGLPDARSIKLNQGAKQQSQPADGKAKKKTAKSSGSSASTDPQTLALLKDLLGGTVAYTRGSMADDSVPTQSSIDEARDILTAAQKRVGDVGDDVDDQVNDSELMQLTSVIYSRIPKKKPVGAAASTWILSKQNIQGWRHDLDAFESALYATDIEEQPAAEFNPLADMRLDMNWIDPKSKTGKFLYDWWPKATGNRHHYVGKLKIYNMWEVSRHDDEGNIPKSQDEVLKDKPKIKERALYQPKTRGDLSAADQKRFKSSNTALMFHGTRSVNVSGILRESLRMPKQLVGVVITGAMFGPGLYFADDWKKSAGYTSIKNSYWVRGEGAVAGRKAFMFACDVVLGEPFVAPKAKGYVEPPKGHHSVFGKRGVSQVLQNNEFVVYRPERARLRYLVEFTCDR